MILDDSLPVALTIAGSDSGAGAGIQADLKTFASNQVYGCTVVTALTAQNTLGVQAVLDVDSEFIGCQIDSIFSDFNIQAIKVGMLNRSEVIEVIVDRLKNYQKWLVVDPVMVATSGDLLLQETALETLKKELLPKASLITPNWIEAKILAGFQKNEEPDRLLVLDRLKNLTQGAILLKGGHNQQSQAVDLFYDGVKVYSFKADWIETKNTHGTGCSLSSAIASFLVKGESLYRSVELAKIFITEAIFHADRVKVGKGRGAIHHFYREW